jgi:CheY-like chemotaxis protein
MNITPDSTRLHVLSGSGQAHARACGMVVDNDDGVREFMAYALEMPGAADIRQFRSGSEALAAFAAEPERFQFVLTDLDMPGMNGIQLCRRLIELAPHLKIVLATGSAAANEAGARRCGFCGLLAKPFSVANLWRAMESIGVLDRAACGNELGNNPAFMLC